MLACLQHLSKGWITAIVNQNGITSKVCANPEKYDEALRRYREAHREEINAKARERRQQNLEHYREIGRKSREKHAEERNAYQRA